MVRLLAPAELELDDAVAYYDAQLAGLGNAFLPAWRTVRQSARRARTRK